MRTRRVDPRVQLYVPQRTGAVTIQYHDHSRLEAFDFLEAWRSHLSDNDIENPETERIFASFVDAALSHPMVLLRTLNARLATLKREPLPSDRINPQEISGPRWTLDGERVLLEQRCQLIAAALSDDLRTLALANWLGENREIRKLIVFTDDSEVANAAAIRFQTELRDTVTIRYRGDLQDLKIFQEPSARSILICDKSVEEGLNLQHHGAAIVHYDLPLDPSRVEQRIGRVDRIEARGKLRNIIFAATATYEREWYDCLVNTIRIFHRSVAPLQYALAEATLR
jgi:ATP-dependent helicase HepA